MTRREQQIISFMQSRPMAVLLAVAATIMALAGLSPATAIPFAADRGLAIPSPNLWFGSTGFGAFLSFMLMAGCAALMIWLNARYSIVRNLSNTFAGLFMLMTAASPAVALEFQGSTLLAIVVTTAIALFYSAYNVPNRGSKRIFLSFALLSAGALCQYGFAVFIPVFIIGIGQMRALKLRTLLSMTLGCITPLWLWWCFSPGFPSLSLPELTNPFEALPRADAIRFFVTVGLTLLVGLIIGGYNMIKIYSYNAKARALNGLLSLVGIATGAAMLIDWTNAPFYVALLNSCVAFQVGHFFNINSTLRVGYIVLLALIAFYAGVWIWGVAA